MFNPEFVARARAKRKGLELPAESVAVRAAASKLPAQLLRSEARDVLREARLVAASARRDRDEARAVLAEARAQATAILDEASSVLSLARQGRSSPVEVTEPIAALRPAGDIIADVAKARGVRLAEIFGQTRAPAVVAARKEAMCAVWQIRPDLGLSAIARIFRRDRQTLRHAIGLRK